MLLPIVITLLYQTQSRPNRLLHTVGRGTFQAIAMLSRFLIKAACPFNFKAACLFNFKAACPFNFKAALQL
jgi:hypothetical protein